MGALPASASHSKERSKKSWEPKTHEIGVFLGKKAFFDLVGAVFYEKRDAASAARPVDAEDAPLPPGPAPVSASAVPGGRRGPPCLQAVRQALPAQPGGRERPAGALAGAHAEWRGAWG